MSCSLTSSHSNPWPIVSYTSLVPPGLGLPATMSWGLPSMAQPIPQCVAHVCYLTTHRAPPEAPQETSPIWTRRQDETMHPWGNVWAPKALDSKSHSHLPQKWTVTTFPHIRWNCQSQLESWTPGNTPPLLSSYPLGTKDLQYSIQHSAPIMVLSCNTVTNNIGFKVTWSDICKHYKLDHFISV